MKLRVLRMQVREGGRQWAGSE